jgi:flagellar basal body rod protein FlgG
MTSRLDTLDLLANNLANSAAAGYKSDRESYSLYLSPDASAEGSPARLPVINGRWTDFSQGLLQTSGTPTHMALEGDGFFVVDGPSGPLYTRNGTFRMSARGTLETNEGYPVATETGRPLQLDPSLPFTVSQEGAVSQTGTVVDRLRVVKFPDPQALSKRSGTYFQWLHGAPSPAVKSSAQILQGQLESGNAGASEGAVQMVSVLREFEMLQKAMTLGGEMNRRAIEEVAKV